MRKASLSVVAKVIILEEQGKGGSMAMAADAMIGEVGWCVVGGLGCRWLVLGAGWSGGMRVRPFYNDWLTS